MALGSRREYPLALFMHGAGAASTITTTPVQGLGAWLFEQRR